MPDRTQPPKISTVTKLYLPTPEKHVLQNGIPLYLLNMGQQEVVKIQLVVRAGRPFEHKKLIAKSTARLIREGTTKISSSEVAETIDFYGATLSTTANLDFSVITLYCLSKQVVYLLPLLEALLTQPDFPQKELDTFVQNSKRKLQVDLSKNDVVAYRMITELIFGKEHPYGYNSSQELFEDIRREDLQRHFRQYYHANNCFLFVSGFIPQTMIDLLDKHFGQLPGGTFASYPDMNITSSRAESCHFPIKDTLQTAIRIGKKMPNRHHPDQIAFSVLNTALGGYFGSRLMMNIREKKGYTYNIYSTQDNMVKNSCFYIATETGNEFVEATKKEIYHEIYRLQQEPIPAEELAMVKNYMLGNMLNMVDGPFQVAEVIRLMVCNDLPFDHFDRVVKTVQEVTATQLQDLAQKYLSKDDMWEVTAG